jgi:hypothetical protein
VGLVRAVELYLQQDFEAEQRTWEQQRDYLVQRLSLVPHVCARPQGRPAPGAPGSFYLPAAAIDLDEAALGMTTDAVVELLRAGEPGIVVDRSPTGIILRVHMMQQGEEKLVADRFAEILSQ